MRRFSLFFSEFGQAAQTEFVVRVDEDGIIYGIEPIQEKLWQSRFGRSFLCSVFDEENIELLEAHFGKSANGTLTWLLNYLGTEYIDDENGQQVCLNVTIASYPNDKCRELFDELTEMASRSWE